LLLVAALLAIWAPARSSEVSFRKVHFTSVMLTLLSATALGIGLVTEKALLGHMDIGAVYLIGWSTQTLALVLLAAKDMSRKTLRQFKLRDLVSSMIMGVTGGLTGIFYVYAIFHSDNISLVTALTAVALPLTALGAYLILHEKERQKLIWASLAVSFLGLLVTAL